MTFLKGAAVAAILSAGLLQVYAHGLVTGIIADGTYFPGYVPQYQWLPTEPIVAGWSIPTDIDLGFIAPDAYTTPDMICHKGATPGQTSATVKAGGTITLEWTNWAVSHHGPVTDYLANCNGPCETVDKTKLKFFKIDEEGLFEWNAQFGNWASDKLISNNNSWTITIPSDIAPGNYVLRHEIIALHQANLADGAQSYPQCINLRITGSGTANPPGILGTSLYTPTDPGIFVNIYLPMTTYIIPGPPVYKAGAAAGSNPLPASTAASASGQQASTPRVTAVATAAASASGQQVSTPRVTAMATAAAAPTTAAAAPLHVVTVTKYVDCNGDAIGFSPPTYSNMHKARAHPRELTF